MTKYLVHKAVEFSAVTVKARKALGAETVEDLADLFYAQRKYDGCNGVLIVKPNEQVLLSRTGEVVKSCDHIRRAGRSRAFNAILAKGEAFVLLGEVWRHGVPQATISGYFRRSQPCPALKFIAFDILPLADFERGQSDIPFSQRYDRLATLLRDSHATDTIRLCETYAPGSYGGAYFLCDALVAAGGYDGAILRAPDGLWKAGSGTTGETIKVKRRESYDLRCIGIEEGEGRNAGRVGALVMRGPKGKVKVNAGTDKQRETWMADPSLIVGKIVEVFCLGFTSTGSLREPTLGEVRFDKEKADYE